MFQGTASLCVYVGEWGIQEHVCMEGNRAIKHMGQNFNTESGEGHMSIIFF